MKTTESPERVVASASAPSGFLFLSGMWLQNPAQPADAYREHLVVGGKMKRPLVLLSMLALVSACTARSEIHVLFDSPDSGVVRMVMAGDSQLREAMLMDYEGPVEPDWDDPDFVAEVFDAEDIAEEEGTDVAVYRSGDFVGLEATKRFSSLDELSGIMHGDGATGSMSFVTDEKTISLVTTGFVEDVTDGAGAGMAELLQVEMNLHVKFPGEVESHNATRVADDGTLVWEYRIDGSATSFEDPEATAQLSSSGLPVALVVVAGVVVVIAVLAVVMARRREEPAGLPVESTT